MESNKLLSDLEVVLDEILIESDKLYHCSASQLTKRLNAKSWNVLECLEHMNLYGDYYLTEIERAIKSAKHKPDKWFKSGWLGNYSANAMLPKTIGKVNLPMKTFPKMDPINQKLEKATLDKFKAQNLKLKELLILANKVNLSKTKCRLTIKWLKFNLGDTFRFMINHNKRHMIQIERILHSINES